MHSCIHDCKFHPAPPPSRAHCGQFKSCAIPTEVLLTKQSKTQPKMELSFSDSPLFFLHLLSFFFISYLFMRLFRASGNAWRSSNHPPGSYGLPLIGETLAFVAANNSSKGLYDFVHARHLKYGSCFKTRIFGETHVFVSSVEAAKVVLSSESHYFTKRYIRSIAELLGEQSLLCVSQEQHKFLHNRISNLFTMDSMSSSIEFFDELVIKTIAEWKRRKSAVVLDDAMKITFNAICKMLMSLKEEKELELLRKDVLKVTEAMVGFPFKLPWTRFYKGLQARERIMNTVKRIIGSRGKGLEYHEDFLQALMMRNGTQCADLFTDKQILDNILTLIIAGQVTTASAITWMVKYLDENQEVQDNLRVSQLQFSSKAQSLDLEVLSKMSYASKVVKESLRLMTIVSWFPRVALKDCEIQGFQIKKGWIVNIDARSIHLDPKLYEDAMKLKPSRFEEDPKPYSFLAFGVGGRTCLGMNLAKAMMLVFLHRLTTTCRWKVIDSDSSIEKWGIFPRLRSGCPIDVTPIKTEFESHKAS